ncbi:MAG TPA: hypothetical protein VMH83_14700 [Candidatus Acidoferrum sp.]|nr:hypothetical protein [Candidatus Acidoferrum sp.]
MNFAEFQSLRQKLKRQQPSFHDCAETNLYRALAHLAPAPNKSSEKIYRCDLARQWCEYFGFAAGLSPQTLVSGGVRDSLSRLFNHCHQHQSCVWLPADCYPVYAELAMKARCKIQLYTSFPVLDWPQAMPTESEEILLLTNPLKPHGRPLDEADIRQLEQWLASSPRRRLWIDCVYTFDTQLDTGSLRLFAGGQTLLLHSLTKGWLHPRLFGTTMVPHCDLDILLPLFRETPPPQANLAVARACLDIYHDTPKQVGASLRKARAAMLEVLPAAVAFGLHDTTGYFFPTCHRWSDLFAEQNILGLPATVFGASNDDFTILSSLAFAS